MQHKFDSGLIESFSLGMSGRPQKRLNGFDVIGQGEN